MEYGGVALIRALVAVVGRVAPEGMEPSLSPPPMQVPEAGGRVLLHQSTAFLFLVVVVAAAVSGYRVQGWV
jgi:hypothetical protein